VEDLMTELRLSDGEITLALSPYERYLVDGAGCFPTAWKE
jgi:hypothetical protein